MSKVYGTTSWRRNSKSPRVVYPVADEPNDSERIEKPILLSSTSEASTEDIAVEDTRMVATYSPCSKCCNKHYKVLYGMPPRQLSSEELREATEGFVNTAFRDETLFKGNLDGHPVYVALRGSEERSDLISEVNNLKSLRHPNIIALRGFCQEDNSQAIVFNFICSRNLHFHLSTDNPKPMQWISRAKLAVELAKGLVYLHAGCSIIHGNVNSLNVFVTHDFVPVIGDFSLSRRDVHGVTLQDRSNDKKARGYLAPEYFERGTQSEKQDIYAFGVILFELISGRAAFDSKKREFLDKWGRKTIEELEAKEPVMLAEGRSQLVEIMVDKRLRESEFDAHMERALFRMIQVAKLCTDKDPTQRPSMTQVLERLSAGQRQS